MNTFALVKQYGVVARLLLMLLFAWPVIGQAGWVDRCYYSAFGWTTSRLTNELQAAGYNPANAVRIAQQYPDVARQIAKLRAEGKAERAKPITIYRGLKKPWREYRPGYMTGDFDGTHFTYYPDTAFNYTHALLGDPPIEEGTVIEVQVPRFMFRREYRVVLDETVPVMYPRHFWQRGVDFTPFITGVARRTSDQKRIEDLKWQTYDEAERERLGR